MARCTSCGKWKMSMQLDTNGLCRECAEEEAERTAAVERAAQAKKDEAIQAAMARLESLNGQIQRIKEEAAQATTVEHAISLMEEMLPLYTETVSRARSINELSGKDIPLPPGDIYEALAAAYEEQGRFQDAYALRAQAVLLRIPLPGATQETAEDRRARDEERQKLLDLRLTAQGKQLEALKDADAQYKADHDLAAYIAFWEELMANGGLLFHGSYWDFRLPDLYIKAKRYDDALKILFKMDQPYYEDKRMEYIIKIYIKQERYEEAIVLLERMEGDWFGKKEKYMAQISKKKGKEI